MAHHNEETQRRNAGLIEGLRFAMAVSKHHKPARSAKNRNLRIEFRKPGAMDLQAQTDEETEVLLSIYSGDDRFRKIDDKTFQYRVESDDASNNPKSFMMQIKWTDGYPETLPDISLDIFYNSHLPSPVKEEIRAKLLEEARIWIGSAMTYTLFEYAKENINTLVPSSEFLQLQKENKEQEKLVNSETSSRNVQTSEDANAGKPRGWNWMDVVKHLNQTGVSSLVASS